MSWKLIYFYASSYTADATVKTQGTWDLGAYIGTNEANSLSLFHQARVDTKHNALTH